MRVNDGPSGWVMSSWVSGGLVLDSRSACGTRSGMYSPITFGGGTGSPSSISSNSMVATSMMQCSPVTGLAYGLAPSRAFTHVSDQPSRRPRYFSGITASP